MAAGHNVTATTVGRVHSSKVDEYAALDALPRPVKEMLWNAAYEASAIGARNALAKEPSVDAFLAKSRGIFAAWRDRELAKVWPEGHPMLGRPLREDWT